jgi:hypothetical protein
MRESIKLAREIAKKCFRVNEVVNGTEYAAVFDKKLCAQLVEKKFTSYNNAMDEICRWTLDVDTCSYDTECGEKWQFFEGTPEENRVVFCHGCGKRVSVV